MKKPCEYCGCDLPLGVDKNTRRIRSKHFLSCKMRDTIDMAREVLGVDRDGDYTEKHTNHLERNCEWLDAAVFTGDMMYDPERYAMFKGYLSRWNRAVEEHNKAEMTDATPSAQPAQQEPVAKDWEGAEYWMPLAWELCADEWGEEACTELIWEGGPIPEPWGERWLKYEDEAKRLIALVQKHTTSPAQPAVQEPLMEPLMEPEGKCKECLTYNGHQDGCSHAAPRESAYVQAAF